MWPSEYMLHEHRKDMLRLAAENTLAREVRGERQPITQSLIRVFKQIRLRRPHSLAPEVQPCPQPVLRRVS
jgi:hypothetical protein